MQFSNPAIHWDEMPKHHNLVLHPVQPAYKNILFIERLIWWLIVSAGITAALIWIPFFQKKVWVLVGITFCLLLIIALLFTAAKSYYNMGFALRKHDIVFRKGWLFETLHIVPLKKIQHCELKRGPLERNYGLASLKIFTAGSMGADVTLSGLPFQEAAQMKDWLISGTEMETNEVIENDTDAAGME
jgi:uncharacterized protein